jgi:hypothetical protein
MKKVLLSGLLSLLIIINFGCQFESIVEPNKDSNQQSVDKLYNPYTQVQINIYQNNSLQSTMIVNYTKTGMLWFGDTWHNFNTLKSDIRNTFDVHISFTWNDVGTYDPYWGIFEFNGNSYFSYTLDNNLENSGFAEATYTNVDLSPTSQYSYKAWVESIAQKDRTISNK